MEKLFNINNWVVVKFNKITGKPQLKESKAENSQKPSEKESVLFPPSTSKATSSQMTLENTGVLLEGHAKEKHDNESSSQSIKEENYENSLQIPFRVKRAAPYPGHGWISAIIAYIISVVFLVIGIYMVYTSAQVGVDDKPIGILVGVIFLLACVTCLCFGSLWLYDSGIEKGKPILQALPTFREIYELGSKYGEALSQRQWKSSRSSSPSIEVIPESPTSS